MAIQDVKPQIIIALLREGKYKFRHFVGNKAKGRISKWVFQENKACQIFRKTNMSYPVINTRMCAYQGVRNVRFSENWT